MISANQQYGIHITGSNTLGTDVEGNDIGTDASGTKPLGNVLTGVLIDGGSTSNVIGGTVSSESNIISYNDSNGVELSGMESITLSRMT